MIKAAKIKRLSYAQFRRIALSEKPDVLLKLPKEAMPDEIPRSLLKEVDYQHRPMLENLIFEISSHKLNVMMSLAKELGMDVQDAVAFSNQSIDSEEFTLFKKASGELARSFVKNKKAGTFITPEAFKESFATTKVALNELRRRVGKNLNAKKILTEASKKARPEHLFALKNAINHLDDKREVVEKAVSAFFFICVSITSEHMVRNRTHIEESEAQAVQLYSSIEMMRDNLKDLCSNYFKKKVNSSQINQLKNEIILIENQINRLDIMISEDDLLLWLDVLVEACLSSGASGKSDSKTRSARLTLFYLLNKYCFIQEEGARQVAKNPFLRADPKKAIQFMLSSETFILKYFSEKRIETTSWFGASATSRIEDIGNLEQDLLNQMKRTAKKLG